MRQPRLEVRVATTAQDARAWAGAFLAAEPVLRNIVATTIESVGAGASAAIDPLWCRVLDGAGAVVGVAMHTPPYGAALTDMPELGADAAAREMHRRGRQLPMASGPDPGLAAFARTWAKLTGVSVQAAHELGVFALEEVVDPPAPRGALRAAGPEEHGLLVRWAGDFGAEAGVVIGDPDAFAARVLERPAIFLWDTGEPVCMVAHTLPGAGVVRVGPVFTPPAFRRRGYAAAATAAVSRRIVAAGHRCMLFTDLANPTSTGIYRRIGYRQVAVSRDVRFGRG